MKARAIAVVGLSAALIACAAPRGEHDVQGSTWNAIPGWPEDRPAALIDVAPGIQVVSVDGRKAPIDISRVRVPAGDRHLELLCERGLISDVRPLTHQFADRQLWRLTADYSGAGCQGRLTLVDTQEPTEAAQAP